MNMTILRRPGLSSFRLARIVRLLGTVLQASIERGGVFMLSLCRFTMAARGSSRDEQNCQTEKHRACEGTTETFVLCGNGNPTFENVFRGRG